MHCRRNGRLSEQADADRRFGCCARAAPGGRPKVRRRAAVVDYPSNRSVLRLLPVVRNSGSFVGQAGAPGVLGDVSVNYRLEYRSTISEIGSPTHTM